ncbi:MAG: alpha-E domain-containing protein [Dermatophilaceae bacterium]
MLSRIAESLFWIGRYLERAEDTARMLDVHLQMAVDDPVANPRAGARLLLTVMGASDGPGHVDQDSVMRRLCHDPDSPSSVVSAIVGARESARRSRETVSTEMWEAVNTTWHGVRDGWLGRQLPTEAFRWVRERCAVIGGIADGTMSHDQGWHFLVLGRTIERVDMTSRLVLAAAMSPSVASAWTSTLRACGAHHAFVRGNRDQDDDHAAAAFLILDRDFPRSLVHTLLVAEQALDHLDGGQRRTGGGGEAARLLGRARAELEYRALGELLTDLPDRMAALQRTCVAANDAISRQYFEGAVAAEWHEGA